MAAEMGIVKTLIGTATATSPDGSQRNLLLGDRVYADEIITTDSTSDIEIEFSEGDVLDSSRNSKTMLNDGLSAAEEITSLNVDNDINAIQQALLRGEDPTQIAQATSAGTAAGTGTGAKSGNEGVTIVNTDYLAPEAIVTSGFETTGPARIINDFEDFDLFEDVVTLTQSATPTPLIFDLTLSVDEDNTLTSTVLENPVDINGLPLTVTDFTVNGITQTAGTPVTIDNVGTLTIDPNGDLAFTPVANYNGTVPTVTHNISNGTTTDDSTLQIIVNSVDDVFTDANESDSVDEDTIKTGSVLADPIDVNGLPLSVTAFTVNGITATAGNPVNIPNVGSLTIDPNGDYIFTPVANYNGSVPTATYTVTNGDTSVQSNLDITVNAVQDTFTDENETVIGDGNTTLTGSVLESSTDDNGLPLTVTNITINGTTVTAGTPVDIPNVGLLTIDTNGNYTFEPVTDFNGPVPTADYTVTNGDTTDDSTLDITINPATSSFTDANETVSGDEDTEQTGTVLEKTVDDNGVALTVTTFTVAGTTVTAGTPVDIPNVGSLTIDPNGNYTFTPVPNFNGDVPTATYTVTNSTETDQSTLDITVTPSADTFTDENETVIGDGNTTLTGSVLESSTDDNNLPLTVTSFTVNGTTVTAGSPVDIPNVGLLTIGSDGEYTFIPVTDFNGPVPTADYTVTNGETTDDSTLDITINPVTSSFTDANETVSGNENTEQTGTVLEKTVDDNGAALTVTTFTVAGITGTPGTPVDIPNVGSLTIDPGGNYTFTPVTNFNGAVPTATYTVTNGSEFDQSTLDITVNPATDTFTDDDETGSGLEDAPQSGAVLADPTSTSVTSFTVAGTTVDIPDGGSNSIDIDNIGTITIESNGDYLFTPVEHYSGAVPPIAYTVTNGTATDTSELTIEVTPVADAPNLSIIVDNNPSLILPPTSGLTKTVFAATGQNHALLDSDVLEELTDNLSATGTNINQPYPTGGKNPSTNIAVDSIEATTGLIYLEAGSTISFSGFADDSLLIELGGKTLVSTTGDMWGEYDSAEVGTFSGVQNLGEVTTNGLFTADKSGYYTLEMYVYNHGGPGRLTVNVSIDGNPATALSSDDLPLYINNSSVNVPDDLFEDLDFDKDTDGGFYQADPDGYDYAIKLDASLIDTDGSETLSGISLTDLPAGVTLSSAGNPDGTYNPGTYNLISDHTLTEAEINAIKGSVTSEELETNATPKTATTVEFAEIGNIDTALLDSSAGEGTALNPADLLTDDSGSIDGLADHTGGAHFATTVETVDLPSLAITNPITVLPDLLTTDSINLS